MEELNTREDLQYTVRELRNDLERAIDEAGEDRMALPGSFGEWSFKDLIAHLTAWREVSARRLEAGLSDEEPVFPWPPHLEEDKDTDAINDWFFRTNRDKPLADILQESRQTFDRVESAIATLPKDDLFMIDRYSWLQGYALGPTVVRGTHEHYRIDHEPEILAWLERE
jgi:hypothetical protein